MGPLAKFVIKIPVFTVNNTFYENVLLAKDRRKAKTRSKKKTKLT